MDNQTESNSVRDRPETRSFSRETQNQITQLSARILELEGRTFMLDQEDVHYYLEAAHTEAVTELNRAGANAVAQMTAEFAPITARTKALVAGLATSNEVQAINNAFVRAIDKTEKLQTQLNETKKMLEEERQKRMALEAKVDEMYRFLSKQV